MRKMRDNVESNINRVSLTPSRQHICNSIYNIIEAFFTDPSLGDLPFRGFLLEGPPSTGKTEIARQVVRKTMERITDSNYIIEYKLVDGADIAAPKWGEAEKKLRKVFNKETSTGKNSKKIIIFDDIDCLMLNRESGISKEYHFSINSILFHELDKLKPSRTLIIATTNKPKLIDDALRARLKPIEVPRPPIEELLTIARDLLEKYIVDEGEVNALVNEIEKKLRNDEIKRDLRSIQHIVTEEVIKRKVA